MNIHSEVNIYSSISSDVCCPTASNVCCSTSSDICCSLSSNMCSSICSGSSLNACDLAECKCGETIREEVRANGKMEDVVFMLIEDSTAVDSVVV